MKDRVVTKECRRQLDAAGLGDIGFELMPSVDGFIVIINPPLDEAGHRRLAEIVPGLSAIDGVTHVTIAIQPSDPGGGANDNTEL